MISITNGAEEYAGLSTDDPKPTVGIANGSKFIEMDTGLTYYFDAENGEWVQFPPAESSDPDSTE